MRQSSHRDGRAFFALSMGLLREDLMKRPFTLITLLVVAFVSFRASAVAAAKIKNEATLPKGADSYVEARHIVIRGSNEEIGRALGRHL
jgi:hypothetical protein